MLSLLVLPQLPTWGRLVAGEDVCSLGIAAVLQELFQFTLKLANWQFAPDPEVLEKGPFPSPKAVADALREGDATGGGGMLFPGS